MRKRPIVKAIFGLMVSLFSYGGLEAAHLTPEQALQRLEKTTSMKKVSGIKPELCHTQQIEGEDYLYVFNKGSRGFIIASADDRMPPVLGYSDTGMFRKDKMPPAFEWLLEQYALSAKYAKENNHTVSQTPLTRSARHEIEPLIQTKWGQADPYNYFCPEKDGEKCAPGSAATAMAQIINYHRYPEHAFGSHQYEWNNEMLFCDFESTALDYDMMANYVGEMPWLIYACAISVETDFNLPYLIGPYLIGGKVDETKIPYAFTRYFNYDSGIRLIYREMLPSIKEWEDIIYSELEAGRPVLYGGRTNNCTGGREYFICDGFREEEACYGWESSAMIHINWGFEEDWDGYFDLSVFDESLDFLESGESVNDFYYNHSIVCGIQPSTSTEFEQFINYSSIYAIGGIQDVILDDDENWNSCLRLSFDGGIFSYKPSNYWPDWDEPEEVTFFIKSVSENGEEYISERGTPMIFYPNDEETWMHGYNEIYPLYPPEGLPEGIYKSYLIYQTPNGEMHDLMFRSNGPKYFFTEYSYSYRYFESYRDYEYRSPWYNTDSYVYFTPQDKVISGLPTPFQYSFSRRYDEYGGYEGLVYVRVFKNSGIDSNYPIYPEENSCNGYDLMKEDVFMLRGDYYGYYFEGSVELKYDLRPGEYELICYDQNGDRMTEPFTLIIEPEEGDYHLDISATLENSDSWSWNNIEGEHVFNIEGTYSNPMDMEGYIEYCVDNRDWIHLTDLLYVGSPFQSTIYAWFEKGLKVHSINLRIVDVEGNITMVEPMKFPDINYIQLDPFEEAVYNGEPHFQNVTSPDVESDGFIITEYYNNVNAGTASFSMEGVYPKSIGMRWCEFDILPAQIQGTITLAQTEFDFTGKDIYPAYELHGPITSLKKGNYGDYDYDYEIKYEDNRYAGKAYVRAQGRRNYTGSIWASFNINKIDCPEEWISYKLPDPDITFDGEPHKASDNSKDGVGKAIFTYEGNGVSSTDAPVKPGDYEVYLQYKEGRGVNEVPVRKIGEFSIYELNDEDWRTLNALHEELSKANEMDTIWYAPRTDSKAWAGRLNKHRLKIEKGVLKSLDLSKKGLKGEFPLSAFRFYDIEELSLGYNQLSGKIDRLATLMETEGTSMKSLRRLALNNNMMEGNAGVLASLPDLEWIAINDNCISDIIPMIGKDKTLVYKNQTLKDTVDFKFMNLDFTTFDSGIPTIAMYDHSAQRYTFEGRNIDLADDKDWNIHMSYREGRMNKTSSTEDVFTGSHGELLEAVISPVNCKATIALRFQDGDVNFDSYVNVLDVQAMINHIFERRIHAGYTGNIWYDPFNHTAADLFEDEIINVQDAVRLVDIIMESDLTDTKNMRKAPKASDGTEAECYAFIDNGNIILSSEKGIAAFDIVIEDPDIALASIPDFRMTKQVKDGKTRIIGYSLSGKTLPEGSVRIGYSGALGIRYAMISDVNANELNVALNDHAAGVSTIATSDFIYIDADHIVLSIPAGSKASWQISTVSGLTLHKGTATADQEGIVIPFKGEAGSVYIISVNHEGKQFHKKIIMN